MTARRKASGRLTFPPRPVYPFTRERKVARSELFGRGPLHSHTIVRAAPRGFAQLAPYRVCIVHMNEGLRAAGVLVCETEPRIKVAATVPLHDDGPLLGFVQ